MRAMKLSGYFLFLTLKDLPERNVTIFSFKNDALNIKEIKTGKTITLYPSYVSPFDTNDKVIIRDFKIELPKGGIEKDVDLFIDYPELVIQYCEDYKTVEQRFRSIDAIMPIGFKLSHSFFP